MVVVLALVACSTLTPAEKEARRVAMAQAVKKALDDKHYKIDVQMMYPQRGPAKNISGNYSVEVKGDTLDSYLPYFGRSYRVPYGGGKGLNFTALIDHYSMARDQKGAYLIDIELTNDEDTYTYLLTIYENGSTTVDVRSRQRDPITFSGQMDIEE